MRGTHSEGSPAGKVVPNQKYNLFTGGEKEERQATNPHHHQAQNERERRIAESDQQHPPWATHEGQEGAIPLKNG